MDDKEDPYTKSNTTKSPLPPISSLRPHAPYTASRHGSSEKDCGYDIYQLQKQLYLPGTFTQNSPLHFHQHQTATDFSLQTSVRDSRSFHHLPQADSLQNSSYHNSSTQDSNLRVREQFPDGLQQPPIPDISLSLPFSFRHEHMLGSSYVAGRTKNIPNAGLFPSNNPPVIPLSQIESFLSETEQNSLSGFSNLSQALNDSDMMSSWQTYNSESSQQLPSYSSLSPLMSVASGMWENTQSTYLTTALPGHSDGVATFNKNVCLPENSYGFLPSSSSGPTYSTSGYQLSSNHFPGNAFLPNSGNMVHNNAIPHAEFSRTDDKCASNKQMFHTHFQSNLADSSDMSYGQVLNRAQKTADGGESLLESKRNPKASRKKRPPADSHDNEVKTVLKKRKAKTSRKAACNSNHESSVADDVNESASFCLSPSFIASLSSKRASDDNTLTKEIDSHVGQHSSLHQRCHSAESTKCAGSESIQVPEGVPLYTETRGAYPNIITSHCGDNIQASGSSESSRCRNAFPQNVDSFPSTDSMSSIRGIPQTFGSYPNTVPVFSTNNISQTFGSYPSTSTNSIPQTSSSYPSTASVSNTSGIPQTSGSYPSSASVSNTSGIPQASGSYPSTASVSNTSGIPHTSGSYPSTATVSSTNCIPHTLGSYPNTALFTSHNSVPHSSGSYQNAMALSACTEFSPAMNSQLSNTYFCAAATMPVWSLAQKDDKKVWPLAQNDDKKDVFESVVQSPYTLPTSDFLPRSTSNKNKFNESLKVDISDDRSSSPFQLSPGFLSSLSSKRADEHPAKNETEVRSAVEATFNTCSKSLASENYSSNYHLSKQPVQSSVTSSTYNLPVTYTQSKLQTTILASTYVRQADFPAVHTFKKYDPQTISNSASHKYSGCQDANFEMVTKQMASPRPYISPPAKFKQSNFQYPTPPMEDDEGRLLSPGPCLSPGFLDNLSQKVVSSDMSHRLTPVHDDGVSTLPTPPNSAGPKQFSAPDMTLSKEEQTNRILEIIAREREKMSIASHILDTEPKKRKRKKKCKEIGDTSSSSTHASVDLLGQAEQSVVPFYPEVTLPNKPGAMSQVYPFQSKPMQHEVLWSERNSENLNSEQPNQTIKWENIHHVAVSGICNRVETLLSQSDDQSGTRFHNIDMSAKEKMVLLDTHNMDMIRNTESNGNVTSLKHFPVSKCSPLNRPKMLNTDTFEKDPYAFDDSEQTDLSTSQLRSMKPVVNLPYADHTKPASYIKHVSHVSSNAQSSLPNPTFSDMSVNARTKSFHNKPTQPAFYHTESLMPHPERQLTSEIVHSIESLSSSTCQVVKEKRTPISGAHSHPGTSESLQMNFNNEDTAPQVYHSICKTKQRIENEERSFSSNRIASPFNTEKKQNIHESNVCFQEPRDLTTESTVNNHRISMNYSKEYSTSFPKSSAKANGHMSDVLMNGIRESPFLTAKKKRGRPPKSGAANHPLPLKSKIAKPKLHDKKTSAETPTKVVYKLNGIGVKPSDLNLDQDLVDRLANNLMEVADCSCLGPDHIPSESTEGPYYTQLGAAKDIPGVRKILEQRTGLSGAAIRIEKVIYTGKEGKSKEGCPIAKWIIRRSGPQEKYLCIVRKRPGHFCDTTVIIMVIVAWEGVECHQADTLYNFLISTLPQNGLETDRRCGLNEKKTCACQGIDLLRRGASFSFGCSWSMYYNGCKFARSQVARKFKLKDSECEEELEDKLQKLASNVAPLYSRLAPDAFRNQVQFESIAEDCRLGSQPGRPFSGVTAVVDFCCHSHRDCHNMNNGSTVVVNLTKHRGYEKPDDEQYHVLPLYILDQTDELGSMEGQNAKVRSGSLEILSQYVTQVRRRSTPYRPCQRNRTTPKKQGVKKSPKMSKLSRAPSFPTGGFPVEAFPKKESNLCNNEGLLSQNSPTKTVNSVRSSTHPLDMVPGVGLEDRNQKNMTYTDLMSQQGTPGFGDLYTKFWDYFYTHGEFPPLEWTFRKKFSALSETAKSTVESGCLKQSFAPDKMFMQQQKQQRQGEEQQIMQQHNNSNQQDQIEQQDKQRQHHSLTCFTGKQGIQSSSTPCFTGKQGIQSSSCLPHPPVSPRQQYHSLNYHHEPAQASLTSPLSASPVTYCPEPFSHNSHYSVAASLPSSTPLTSSTPQEHPSTPLSLSGGSSSRHNLLENNENIMQPSFSSSSKGNVVNMTVSCESNSLCNQNDEAILNNAPKGVGDHFRAPPVYHEAISNRTMQGSTHLCRPQSQEQLALCDKGLTYNTHDRAGHCDDHQERVLDSSSNNFIARAYSHVMSQPVRDPLSSYIQASQSENQGDRPSSALVTQIPMETERSLSKRQASSLSYPTPVSSHSEDLSSHLQKLQSAQLPAISQWHTSERSSIDSSLSSRNLSTHAMSCPATAHSHTKLGLAHSVNRQSCVSSTDDLDMNDSVKMHISNLPHPRSVSDNCTPRLLVSEFFDKKQSLHLETSHYVQGTQVATSAHPRDQSHTSHLVTPSGSNRQSTSVGTDGCVREVSSVDFAGSESVVTGFNSVSGSSQSLMSDTPALLSDGKQVEVVRECWSRMSEPSTLTDAPRPSSCFSEPDLVSGWRKEHPLRLTAEHGLVTQHCRGINSEYKFDKSKTLFSEHINKYDGVRNSDLSEISSVIKPEDTKIQPETNYSTPGAMLKPWSKYNLHWFRGNEIDNGKSVESGNNYGHGKGSISLPAHSCKQSQTNLSACSDMVGSHITQHTDVNIQNGLSSDGHCINKPVGSIFPNGPIIGEKMKVHKSEGFVVPKVSQSYSEPPYEVIDSTVVSVEIDDNREVFDDPAMGGVAIALCHGAVLFEVAKRELHATTALKEPNRYQPKRISLVFYQHKNLNLSRHGFDEYERKAEERRNQAEQTKLIEELESKGFFKGELSELASFPSLTKGTFGKVFNFPESKKTLFPLRFPRYLDSSHSELITPVMFACMSIAFPNYMKEAFPDPLKLPRLMKDGMPVRMYSSLSDKRKYVKIVDSDVSKRDLLLLSDDYDKYGVTAQKVHSPWDPNTPQENTATTNSILTRWVHDDINVTGPYNRWVELALQGSFKKEATSLPPEVKAETEIDFKTNEFESLPNMVHKNVVQDSTASSSTSQSLEVITETEQANQGDCTLSTMVVNLDQSHLVSDMDDSQFTSKSSDRRISTMEVAATAVTKVEADPSELSFYLSHRLEDALCNDKSEQGRLNGMIQQNGLCFSSPANAFNHPVKSEMPGKEQRKPTLSSEILLRNDIEPPEHCMDQHSLDLQAECLFSNNQPLGDLHVKFSDQIHDSAMCSSATKSVSEDENLNCMGNPRDSDCSCPVIAKTTHSQFNSSNTTVTECVSNHSSKNNSSMEMETRSRGDSDSHVSGKWESMYDYLMKGLHRPFLSSQQNGSQAVQDGLSNYPSNECS